MPSPDASSALIVHADADRPLIHAHTFYAEANGSSSSSRSGTATQTCQLAARLHPPEVTPTLSLSPTGTMLAAGSASGRLYVWHLPSGRLIASLDAHFRSVTCLEWTADERALVSASDDARILVWSLAALVDAHSGNHADSDAATMTSATTLPFAVLADHVQGVTKIALTSCASTRSAVSSFPASLRIMSASRDGTVKLWDIRTRSLVATWSFQGPVLHLAVDVGFRAFYVTVRGRGDADEEDAPVTGGGEDVDMEGDEASAAAAARQDTHWVRRVDLYGSNVQDPTTVSTTASALTRVRGGTVWHAAAGVRVTAMAMSLAGTHLLLGTSEGYLHMLDVASSVVIRSVSLLPAGLSGKGASGLLEVVGLSNVVLGDPLSILQASSLSGGGSGKASGSASRTWTLAEKLQRTLVPAAAGLQKNAGLVTRLEKQPAHKLAAAIAPPSMNGRRAESLNGHRSGLAPRLATSSGAGAAAQSNGSDFELRAAQQRIADLERDNERLGGLLQRAQKANAGLWERVVQGTFPAATPAANEPTSS